MSNLIKNGNRLIKINNKLISNAAAASGGETWVLNNELTINETATYNVNFISNEMTYISLRMEKGKIANLYYGSDLAYAKDPVGGATWYDAAYRTVIFATAPTGNLLIWLQANGVKQ